MGTETWAGALGELKAAHTTAGGDALSATTAVVYLPKNSYHLFVLPRNFQSSAVVAKVAVNPWLTVYKTADALATAPTDQSETLQDGDTSTSVDYNSLDTAANNDFIYIGSHLQFRGVRLDVSNTNGTASVLTVKYWNGSAWADISATDGTASGGATFAQDGNVTWTVPSDWAGTTLVDAGDTSLTSFYGASGKQELYWTRWEVSVALDASVSVLRAAALNRNAPSFEMLSGQLLEERVYWGRNGVSAVEAVTDTGTASLLVNVATTRGGSF